MSDIATLVADNLDIWTSAIERKSGAGRGGGKRISLYGIDRLRALILDLAVRGKLVPQDAGDEPASELLKSIKSKKPGYLSTQGLPKQRVIAEPLKHLPFELPASWAWTRLGEIAAYIQRGKSPKYSEGSGVFVVSQRCVQWAGLDLAVAKEISRSSFDNYEPYRFLRPNDLLWNSTGTGTIGRVIALKHVPDGLVCDSHVTVVRCPWMNARYLQFWLASNDVYGQIEVLAAGSTNQIEWTAQLAAAQVVPVPPLAEQQRIVAKVDELMALCDALERERAGAMAAHQALVEILLATLVNSADATDRACGWTRLERHFDTLFTTDSSIDALKQTILDLAVRGKLVEQDARDEPAPTLLKRIAEEIADFCAENRITTARTERIEPAQQLFDVPDGWAWSRLAGIFKVITDGDHQPPPKADQGVAFLTIGNVTTGKLVFDGCRLVPERYFKALAKYRTPRQGDILYTVVGATYGRPALVETDRDFCVQRHIAILKPSASMDVRYMVVLLSSPIAYRQASEGTTGSAQPTIALRPLRNFLVPIPPLAEQRRIVAKVDALMALCDRIKTQLFEAAQTQRNLADAITERAAA